VVLLTTFINDLRTWYTTYFHY